MTHIRSFEDEQAVFSKLVFAELAKQDVLFDLDQVLPEIPEFDYDELYLIEEDALLCQGFLPAGHDYEDDAEFATGGFGECGKEW